MRHAAILVIGLAAMPAQAGHELDGRDLDRGRAVYSEHCAACHGADLEGQPDWRSPGADGIYPAPPHDATGHTWHHSNAQLFDYTRLGGQGVIASTWPTMPASQMAGGTQSAGISTVSSRQISLAWASIGRASSGVMR